MPRYVTSTVGSYAARTRTERFGLSDWSWRCVCTGPLPNVLPTSLEVLDLAGGDPSKGGIPHEFTGGIPPEWGALANLKELKMAFCGLDGKPLSIRSERLNGSLTCNLVCACTGELPLEIIRMKAKGIIPGGEYSCGLRGNKGFTLPSNIGELGDDITKLDLSFCLLTGPLSIRVLSGFVFC